MSNCFCPKDLRYPCIHEQSNSSTMSQISPVEQEVDVSKMQVAIPLSLLIEIYTMSVTLSENSIRDQVLKIIKGV